MFAQNFKKQGIWILFFLLFIFFGINFVNGSEHYYKIVDGIYNLNSDIILNQSEDYNFLIHMKSNSILDCKNHKIIGFGKGVAIDIIAIKNVTIKNCNFFNFTKDIEVRKSGRNYPLNINIINNNFTNSDYGIYLFSSKNLFILNNTFKNIEINSIYITRDNSIKIFNNFFYNKSFYYQSPKSQIFCKNGINKNNFFGINKNNIPKCYCLVPLSNMIIDKKVSLCKGIYKNIHNIRIIDSLDCNGATFIGKRNETLFNFYGVWYKNLKNCNIINYNKGVSLLKTLDINFDINFYNLNFINNTYGIYSDITRNLGVKDSSFKGNNYSFYIKNGDIPFFHFGNDYFEKANYWTPSTKTLDFCMRGETNFFKNYNVNKCGCIIPVSNMKLSGKVIICKNNYTNIHNLYFGPKTTIDCNGAKFIGKKNEILFYSKNGYDFLLKNCFIQNYNKGVYFNYYGVFGSFLYNKLSNVTFYNNFYPIYLININSHNTGLKIKNSKFLLNKYLIYDIKSVKVYFNNSFFDKLIFSNLTNISKKYYNNLFFYNSRTDNNQTDYKIKNISIKKIKSYNDMTNVTFVIKKRGLNYDIEPLSITLYDVNNNKILKNKTIYVKDFYFQKKITTTFYVPNNHKIIVIINKFKNKPFFYDRNPQNNFKVYSVNNSLKKVFFIGQNFSQLNLIDLTFNNFLKDESLNNYKIVNSKDSANIIINFRKSLNDMVGDTFLNNKHLIYPYECFIKSKITNGKTYIHVEGKGLDGYFLCSRYLINHLNEFYNKNKIKNFGVYNIEGLKIYDYLHGKFSQFYFGTNSIKFQKEVKNVLYNDLYKIRYYKIPVLYKNKNETKLLNYSLYYLISKNSQKFQYYIYNNFKPIIFSAGLFSNIDSWRKIGRKISTDGRNVFLIELTGNYYNELRNSPDYNYTFLIKNVFPAYINFIENITNYRTLDFVAHSNGARVFLDSISNNYVNKNYFDKVILLGVPGSFENLTFITKILNNSKNNSMNYLIEHNITHPFIEQIEWSLGNLEGDSATILSSFFKDFYRENSISLNLYKQYLDWISSSKDSEPGKNVKLNNFYLIYGTDGLLSSTNNDLIVPVYDEKSIFRNVVAKNKSLISLHVSHTEMINNKLIFNKIKKILLGY